jgi:hypothetical protein
MELVGSRCVLTGSVLHLLKGEALAGVTDLRLAHLPYCEVRGTHNKSAGRCCYQHQCDPTTMLQP